MKKLVVILVVLAVGAALGWQFLWRASAPTEESRAADGPKVATVKTGSIRVVVETTGRVVSRQEVAIKCKASGEVIKLPVDVSDTVKKGVLLMQLDPENEERSFKRAKVAMAVSQARLAQAKLNLDIAQRTIVTNRVRAKTALQLAQAKLIEAKSRLQRVTNLHQRKMASQEELDGTKTANAQAESELANARARLEELKTEEAGIDSRRQDIRVAEAQVESDQLSLSEAEQRLKETTLLAPIDGVVAEKNVAIGNIIASGINNVGGGTTVLTLVDLSRIYVLASVDESDIGRIQTGQPARITVDAHPDLTVPGKVVRVATKGVEVTNVVTFEVKIEVGGSQRHLLKPEMTANVTIVAVEKEGVPLIPVGAVVHRRGKRFVVVQRPDGTTEERPIETGANDGQSVEVAAGLKPGDEVVVRAGGGASNWRNDDAGASRAQRQERMKRRMMGPLR